VDALGHVTKAATIAYGRVGGGGGGAVGAEVFPEQQKTWVALAESAVAHVTASLLGYRHGLPLGGQVYEISGLASPSNGLLYTLEEVAAAVASIGQAGSPVTRRLLGNVKHRYYDGASLLPDPNNPSAPVVPSPLPMGQVDLWALPYESYSLAFNVADLAEYGGRVTTDMLTEGG
jgi:hypothetical protein